MTTKVEERKEETVQEEEMKVTVLPPSDAKARALAELKQHKEATKLKRAELRRIEEEEHNAKAPHVRSAENIAKLCKKATAKAKGFNFNDCINLMKQVQRELESAVQPEEGPRTRYQLQMDMTLNSLGDLQTQMEHFEFENAKMHVAAFIDDLEDAARSEAAAKATLATS